MEVVRQLAEAGFSSYLVGPSALEKYFGTPAGREVWIETEGSLVDLSRIFEGLVFPGAEYFDAALELDGRLYLFRCTEGEKKCSQAPQATLQGTFRYKMGRNTFLDPCGAYGVLRSERLVLAGSGGGEQIDDAPKEGLNRDSHRRDGPFAEPYSGVSPDLRPWYIAAEIALLVGKFGYKAPSTSFEPEGVAPSKVPTSFEPAGTPASAPRSHPESSRAGSARPATRLLTPLEQRFVLNGVLTGKNAAAGLQVLMDSGFVGAHWPLLAAMDEIVHSKEQHPEGNVWRHTLEAFLHRKVLDPELALGLLLHDAGKPFARENNGNRFDQHAQIGSVKARRFLQGLGYPASTVDAVEFLVKYHMVPGALPKLPVYRTESLMASPLFPDLLELYRCDVSSTYRGPDGYYRACRTYRAFLKNSNNPFRTSDGKKRLRLLVE